MNAVLLDFGKTLFRPVQVKPGYQLYLDDYLACSNEFYQIFSQNIDAVSIPETETFISNLTSESPGRSANSHQFRIYQQYGLDYGLLEKATVRSVEMAERNIHQDFQCFNKWPPFRMVQMAFLALKQETNLDALLSEQ